MLMEQTATFSSGSSCISFSAASSSSIGGSDDSRSETEKVTEMLHLPTQLEDQLNDSRRVCPLERERRRERDVDVHLVVKLLGQDDLIRSSSVLDLSHPVRSQRQLLSVSGEADLRRAAERSTALSSPSSA